MNPLAKARVIGALVIAATFVAGFLAGTAWTRRHPQQISVNVRMNTEIPSELRQLGLTAAQEDSLRRVIGTGQRSMRRVLGDFEPRMRATLDSIDAAVQAVLTPAQRARYQAGHARRSERVEIDTVVR